MEPFIRDNKDFYIYAGAQEVARILSEQQYCGRCGDCCCQENIIIEESDADRIAAHLRLPLDDFKHRYLKRNEETWYLKKDNPCVFFNDEDAACGIYPVRPEVCRQFPYQTDWFTKILFDLIKYRLGHGPPVMAALYIGEGCPCRTDIQRRMTEEIDRLIKDIERFKQVAKRAVEEFRESLTE